jgi:hypothetical protein
MNFSIDLSGLGHGESTRNVLIIDGSARQIRVDELPRGGGAIYRDEILTAPLPLGTRKLGLLKAIRGLARDIEILMGCWQDGEWNEHATELAWGLGAELHGELS